MNQYIKSHIFLGCLMCVSFSYAATFKSEDHLTKAPEATEAEMKIPLGQLVRLSPASIDLSPDDRQDQIATGKLGIASGNAALIEQFASEIADGKHGKYDSLMIAHKGKLLFESYYLLGRVNLPHQQASATKAYTSLLLGRAIQLGYLSMDDLDKPILTFFPELNSTNYVEGIEKITLRKALTMHNGLVVPEEKMEELRSEPTNLKGRRTLKSLFENSAPVTTKSQTFNYGDHSTRLVMQVLDAVVPGATQEFIRDEFFLKLGINNYKWLNDEHTGLPVAGVDAFLTPRSMVKIGMLAMNNGNWKGEQLIPEDYIKQATSRMAETEGQDVHYGGRNVANQGFGYFWWNAEFEHKGKTYFASSAQGGYGQFIVLIRELDLIVTFTGHDNDPRYLQLVAERVLPAFVN